MSVPQEEQELTVYPFRNSRVHTRIFAEFVLLVRLVCAHFLVCITANLFECSPFFIDVLFSITPFLSDVIFLIITLKHSHFFWGISKLINSIIKRQVHNEENRQ